MINSLNIKSLAGKYGADLCGIASIDRFESAPSGFHPKDLFESTKSVISIACRVPESVLLAKNPIPYSVAESIVLEKVKKIAFSMSLDLEDKGVKAVMVPSVPYDYWDEENMEGRGLLSLKHIGYYAGLGYIGKNSLLCNAEFGNLIKLGAILTDVVLDPDAVYEGSLCSDSCDLCIKSCPVDAIANKCVSQKKCRPNSEIVNLRGVEVTVCYNCRSVCPNRAGIARLKNVN